MQAKLPIALREIIYWFITIQEFLMCGDNLIMEAIGYDYNDGGINNQKLAIVGLFVAAREGNQKIFLPDIYSKDQHNKSSTCEPFETVFWLDPVLACAERWGIEIVDRPKQFSGDRIIRNGWHYFDRGAGYIDHTITHYRPSVCQSIAGDLVRSMVPRITSDYNFGHLCGEVFFRRGLKTVIQLRIEEDWKLHTQHYLDPTLGRSEDYFISPEEIISKFVYSVNNDRFPDDMSTVFVTCDERYIDRPKDAIRHNVKLQTGVDITFKSDILEAKAMSEMRPIDTSLIDFELSKLSKNFVGLSRSTFANMVCFERSVQKFRNQTSDYIYNYLGPSLRLRKDMGSRPDAANASHEI